MSAVNFSGRGWLLALLLWGSTANLSAGPVCERVVAAGNPQYPPLLWVDPEDSSRLIGVGVDLLREVLAPAGVQVEVLNVGPWARAQEEVRSGRIDMLVGAFLTRERLEYMDYVHPAYMEVPSAIFVRRDSLFPWSGWHDLRGLTGSTLLNNSFGMAFDRYAREYLKIQQVPSIEQSFRQLQLGRVDYVVYERHQGEALLAQLGLAQELVPLEGSVNAEPLYLTLSHNSACNTPALRRALVTGLHDWLQQGRLESLLQRNRERWQGQFAQALPGDEAPLEE